MNDELLERLNKWKDGDQVDPEKVQIYPTNRCNLNCIFCAQRLEDYGYDTNVSKERWIEVTKEISEMSVNRLLISGGGEPLLRADTVLEMMELAKKGGIEGRIITSGIGMDEDVCKRIVGMGWDTVVFSIDGARSQTHDTLRGFEGVFKKVISNVRTLNDMKNRTNVPRLEINFVLNKKNFEEIPEMVYLAHSLGFNSINFEPLTVNNPRDRKLKVSKNDKKKLVEEVIPEASKILKEGDKEVNTNIDDLKQIKMEKAGEMKDEIKKGMEKVGNGSLGNSPCYEPWLWPKIEANGDIWPCSTAPLHENIKDKDFKEIWYGEELQRFRNKILQGELPDSCENCVTSHVKKNAEIRNELK